MCGNRPSVVNQNPALLSDERVPNVFLTCSYRVPRMRIFPPPPPFSLLHEILSDAEGGCFVFWGAVLYFGAL